MNKHIIKILMALITLVVGGFIGFYFEQIKSERENAIQFLDLQVEKSKNVIKAPSVATDDVKIIWKSDPIKSISVLSIKIYNYSNRDYEKLPIYISLKPENINQVDIIAKKIVGEGGSEERVKILGVPVIDKSGTVKYSYELITANRSQGVEPIFIATFFIKGDVLPVSTVDVVKKGIKIRKFSYEHAFKESFLKTGIIIAASIVAIVFYIWLLIYTFKKSRERSLEGDKGLIDHLYGLIDKSGNKLVIFGENISKDEMKKFVQEIREYYWNRRPRLDQLLFSTLKPDIKDLEDDKKI